MNILLRHTLASIARNPVQSVIIMISTAMITACVFICLCISSMFEQLTAIWETSGYGGADVLVYTDDWETADNYLAEYADYIASSYYSFERNEYVMSETNTVRSYMLGVFDLEEFDRLIGAEILESGENDTAYPSAHVSLIFARATDLGIGDTFTTKTGLTFTVTAICNNISRYASQTYAVFAADISDTELIPNRLSVYLKDADAALPDGRTVTAVIEEELPEILQNATSVRADRESMEISMADSVRGSMQLMTIAGTVIIGAMACLLFSSFSVLVRGRVNELIKFKAAGATPMQSALVLLAEAGFYAVIGGLVGLVFGKLLIGYLNGLLSENFAGAAIVTEAYKYPVAVAIGTVCSLAACVIPALRMSLKPIRSLLGGSERISRMVPRPYAYVLSFVTFAFALALFFVPRNALVPIAIIFIVFSLLWMITVIPRLIHGTCSVLKRITRPNAGYIAECAAPRNAAATSSVSMLAALIAFITLGMCILDAVGLTSESSSVRFSGDYVVRLSNISSGIVNPYEELERCLAVDGITDGMVLESVTGVYLAYADGTVIDSDPLDASVDTYVLSYGKDMAFCSMAYDNAAAESFDNAEQPIIVTSYLANKYGISIGDSVMLIREVAEGMMPLDGLFTVVAIDETVTSWDQQVFVKAGTLTIDGETVRGSFELRLNGSGDFSELRNEIDTENATLFGRDGYVPAEGIDRLNYDRLISVFSIIVYSIALIGLVNLIVITAGERRREFDVLRLAGMTPGNAAQYILTETAFLSAIGCASGLAFAFFCNRASAAIAQIINKYIVPELFSDRIFVITAAATGIFILLWIVSHIIAFAQVSTARYRRREDRMLRSD